MTSPIKKSVASGSGQRAQVNTALRSTSKLALVAAAVVALAGCRDGLGGPEVGSWTLADHAQRHPILVTQHPSTVELSVNHGHYPLSAPDRSRLVSFLARHRAQDGGQGRMMVEAPVGTANEVSAIRAVEEIRHSALEHGFDPSSFTVTTYDARGRRHAPVRLTYTTFTAQGPDCGNWSEDLHRTKRNLPYPDFGCADQRNFAAMVKNPADLLGPRTMTPRPGEIREGAWDKFKKGESTVSQKSEDEKVKVSE
ncbi:MAG: CpaD family pilus assembly protein [Hyphomicrobiaceae bacterium]